VGGIPDFSIKAPLPAQRQNPQHVKDAAPAIFKELRVVLGYPAITRLSDLLLVPSRVSRKNE
jgi:hypothetical protein